MRIAIEMLGPLQRYNKGGQRRAELELDAGMSVHELLASLGMDMEEPWNAALDGTLARPSDRVSDGSSLLVFPPIEGG
jgi:sulfur carrier protein ThiS